MLERRGRKESIITLIIMIIIAAVIVSWISGLWSCEAGRKDLTEEERLSIADYVNSVSVLVQQSNQVSFNFFLTLDRIKNISREELDSSLLGIIEESTVISENCNELNPPQSFEVAHGYLKLVLKTRNQAYQTFKPALFNALQDIDIDISSSQMTNAFLYMFMSDEIYKYFQEELQVAGENMDINNLTIIDSVILQDKNLTDTQSVARLVEDLKTVTTLQERRGVAVVTQSIEFDPRVINEQGDFLILSKGTEISVTILIENQGNIAERDVNVVMTYRAQDNPVEEKTYTIANINPSEQKAVTITGFPAYPGRKCDLEVTAGPVPGEAIINNNTASYKFMMEN
ncbi:MAG: CARDB domain-containing protein [Actinomycetota bacterium]|nr:CARDB domain-containing protein [Actinomycetota bacterium]